ncbi:ABC transporter substrate-binding protein [Psychrobacillus sp. NPDC096389]|uniref:ABC transporter substrate-binding protein n=1 Tax=Psychrobacillus sp. NPDC096389 TaxID=3364490 RepID=UPI0038179531
MKKLIIILIVGMIALTGCVASPKQEVKSTSSGTIKEITIAGAGGLIEKMIRDEVAPKFTEKTGIKVNFIAGLSSEILSKVELQKNAPQIDIAMLSPTDVQRAESKELIELLSTKQIPNLAKIDERFVAVDDVSVPIFGYTIAPAYNKDIFEKEGIAPIASWNDLIRPEYKGRTAFSDISSDFTYTILYNLAFANGGSLDNMEPGLTKAKEMAAYSTTFYKNSTQMIPALQQEAAIVTVMGSYNIAQVADSGIPLQMVVPKEGSPLLANSATIVKNSSNKKAAEEFVDLLISPEMQEHFSEGGFYPVIEGVETSDKYESIIGVKESDNLYRQDVPKLAEIRGMWADRFMKEVTPDLGKKVGN